MLLQDTHRDFGSGPIPANAGIGLKAEHVGSILDGTPDIGWFEVHAENHMPGTGPAIRWLEAVREAYPISVHGVGMSLGGMDPLDTEHLGRLKTLVDRIEPGLVSEHLAWCREGGTFLNDLLPVPYHSRVLQTVVEHVDQMQAHLKRTILLENPSLYVTYKDSDIAEPDFLSEIAQRTGCGLLLDVNNVAVSAANLGFDAHKYLDAFDTSHVGEVHVAGHTVRRIGERDIRIDDHGSAVTNDVWELADRAIAKTGPLPVLVERDNDIPPLSDLLAEAAHAQDLIDTSRGKAGSHDRAA